MLPEDLAGVALVLTEVGCSYRELFLRTLAGAGVRPPSIATFASVEAVKQCVMAGMGMALLPAMTVVPEVAAGRLGVVPWAGPEYRLVTRIVLRAYEEASPLVRAAMGLLREFAGER